MLKRWWPNLKRTDRDKAKLFGTCQLMVKTILPKRVLDTDSQLLNALHAGSETLQNITDQFAPLMKQFHVFFFWEQEKTNLGYSRDYIVDESSAAPILDNTERSGIAASHSEMCKFSCKSSPGYTVVVAALRRYERDAPARIEKRWREVIQRLQKTREEEAQELIES
ncbi:MAG: hypothetical protein Q9214_000216 [Letrouitia sp. 1 TL-2023]